MHGIVGLCLFWEKPYMLLLYASWSTGTQRRRRIRARHVQGSVRKRALACEWGAKVIVQRADPMPRCGVMDPWWRGEATFRWSGWGDTSSQRAVRAQAREQADRERGRGRGHRGAAHRGGRCGRGGRARGEKALEIQGEGEPLLRDGLQRAL